MKFTGHKWIPFILTIAVIVLLNVAVSTVPFRADLTHNRAYSLSQASKNAVSTLEEPFTIKAFLSQSLSPPYNNTEQILRDLLEEYALAGNRYFNYSIVTIPTKEELESGKGADAEDEATKYRIYPIQIQTIEQDEVKLQSVYMGVAFIHGDMIETIPALTNTSNLEYQITGLINEMGKKISVLLSMTEDIQVTLYLSENMNALGASFADLAGELKTAVGELNEQYYGRLDFDSRDPIAAGEADILESEYGISPLTLTRRTATGQENEPGYAALVMTHGDDRYATELMSRGIFGSWQLRDVSSLRQTIEDVTEAIIGTNKEIGFASGYGMPALDGQTDSQFPVTSLTPDLANFDSLMSREYELKEIALATDEIPEGLSCLIVAGPTAEIPEYDLFKIDQFLMKGGSLALFLDSHSVFMPQTTQYGQQQQPAYIPRNTGLEEMLAHYGVDLEKAYVLDEQCFIQRQRAASGSIVETPVYYAPVIKDERISDELAFLENIP
ncbi:MAG: GldG family protein, partial [Spirochaetales bacterium]|nr:GldG family protein [Spirochaetales bacterium]